MTTLVLGERPPELEALLQRRRALGLDRRDEVWDGVYVMAPYADSSHGVLESEVQEALRGRARPRGLTVGGSFNLGHVDDFRVPDGAVHATRVQGSYLTTALLVVEVLSPNDQTMAKLPFYASHGVGEVIIVDPQARTVTFLVLVGGTFAARDRSPLLDVSGAELAVGLSWPEPD